MWPPHLSFEQTASGPSINGKPSWLRPPDWQFDKSCAENKLPESGRIGWPGIAEYSEVTMVILLEADWAYNSA
jgi:hypothetical protein